MRAGGSARRLAELIASGGGAREAERLAGVLPTRFALDPRPFDPKPGFTLDGGPDPRF